MVCTLPVSGKWTLDMENQCYTNFVSEEELPSNLTDKRGLLKNIEVPYTISSGSYDIYNYLTMPGGVVVAGTAGQVGVRRTMTSTDTSRVFKIIQNADGTYTGEKWLDSATSEEFDSDASAENYPYHIYQIDSFKVSDSGDYVSIYFNKSWGDAAYVSTSIRTLTVKTSVADATVTGIQSKSYTGSAQTQEPVVKVDGNTLLNGTDYEISYQDNTEPGIATMVITGIGDYTGTISKTFRINPPAPSALAVGGRAGDAIRLNWEKADGAAGYIVEQKSGTVWTRVTKITKPETLTCRITNLTPGTSYDFRVRAYAMDGSIALYSGYVTISAMTNPSVVEDLVIGGRAGNALRLNWTANESASGYIIEQYKDGKWTRIAKITNPATVTYRISGLSAGTSYKFRIKAYAFEGKTALYSGYKEISGVTNPASVTNLEIGGWAKSALRLNWTKADGASGYIIEQYKDGKWVRIVKITNGATQTYRAEGLTTGTTYKFRVKSYAFDGDTAIYSGYVNVSGTTK